MTLLSLVAKRFYILGSGYQGRVGPSLVGRATTGVLFEKPNEVLDYQDASRA